MELRLNEKIHSGELSKNPSIFCAVTKDTTDVQFPRQGGASRYKVLRRPKVSVGRISPGATSRVASYTPRKPRKSLTPQTSRTR
jgi:hypothetical protein